MNIDSAQLNEAAGLILASKWPIALTGAGISVDSGIPDFRGAGGIWERYDPMEYGTIHAFRADPAKVWKMLTELSDMVSSARPNPGHKGLADLERLGLLKAIITQNIDNLHQEAGNTEVIEFHGNGNYLTCMMCGGKYEAEVTADKARADGNWPPECPSCSQVLKPDVVFFGEMIPSAALAGSMMHADKADLILVLGTSATVVPASQIPISVKQRGGRIIEFNLEQTQLSPMADMTILGNTSLTMPALINAIKSKIN